MAKKCCALRGGYTTMYLTVVSISEELHIIFLIALVFSNEIFQLCANCLIVSAYQPICSRWIWGLYQMIELYVSTYDSTLFTYHLRAVIGWYAARYSICDDLMISKDVWPLRCTSLRFRYGLRQFGVPVSHRRKSFIFWSGFLEEVSEFHGCEL